MFRLGRVTISPSCRLSPRFFRSFSTGGTNPYLFSIYTGDRRGAGTHARVFGRLLGENGKSGQFRLRPDDSLSETDEFDRESMVKLQVDVPDSDDIGEIFGLEIGHDNSELGAGWYLDKVEVYDNSTNTLSIFMSGHWFGESDSGGFSGPVKRELFARGHGTNDDQSEEQKYLFENEPVTIRTGSSCVAHPDKIKTGIRGLMKPDHGYAGEDAYAITRQTGAQKQQVVLGVADGVFAWKQQNIDSGLWSRHLLDNIVDFVSRKEVANERRYNTSKHMIDWVQSSYDDLLANGVQGSSTLCVLSIESPCGGAASNDAKENHDNRSDSKANNTDQDNDDDDSNRIHHLLKRVPKGSLLHGLNIGDSGFLVARPQYDDETGELRLRCIFRSSQQEKTFGCPYQLGHHPESDAPSDAHRFSMQVGPGDAIVLGTDGLFDNISDSHITKMLFELSQNIQRDPETDEILNGRSLEPVYKVSNNPIAIREELKSWSAKLNPTSTAHALAAAAFHKSRDKKAQTPYSKAASEEFNLIFNGGKQDDITVIVALVQ